MEAEATKTQFVKSYVLPAIFLFAIPGLGLWFAGHATDRYDADFREAVLGQVRNDPTLGPEERASATRFYTETSASSFCVTDEASSADAPEWLTDLCGEYRWFRWLGATSTAALGIGAFSLVVALLCSLLAFASRSVQYTSFVVGWNVLRLTSAFQTIAQGAIAVTLSFWMTALWFESYFPKLILIVGVLAVIAAGRVVLAIFQKIDEVLPIDGKILTEEQAPELWKRVREICDRLGTDPPKQIIAGIDDNFFVTEGRVDAAGALLEGRTLFVSLSLLRNMEREEADAVLAHEMAHFSGGDTAYSRKLSPLLTRYGVYLEALHQGGLTLPIFYFMLLYRSLFELALSHESRQREHRADKIASETTSPRSMGHALLKVGAYSSYRGRVLRDLFEQDRRHDEIAIPQRVAQGFLAYATTPKLALDLHGVSFPHPFDTHPPLRERLSAIGVDIPDEAYATILAAPIAASWLDAIDGGAELEAEQWRAFEARFAAVHEESLAHRYLPANEEERAIVLKYFPPVTIQGTQGEPSLELTYEGVKLSDWEAPIRFEAMKSCSYEERLLKKFLDIRPLDAGLFGKKSICISKLEIRHEAFVALFGRYYGRHQVMLAHAKEGSV